MSWIGLVGSICLSLCAVPQCFKAWKTKSVEDLSWGFLALWGTGEILLLGYIITDLGADVYMVFNYGINLVCIGFLLGCKLFYSKELLFSRK